jgi:hypothetical protein
MIYRPLVNLDHFMVNRWFKPLALNPANRPCDR